MFRLARSLLRPALAGLLALPLAATAAPSTTPTPTPPPPAEHFAMEPNLDLIRLSPDGQRVVQDDRRNGQVRLVIWQIDGAKVLRVVDIDPNNKLRGLQWADDQTVLLTVSVQKSMPCTHQLNKYCNIEWFRTLSIGVDGSGPQILLLNDADRRWVAGSTMLAARTAAPGKATMSTFDFIASKQHGTVGTRLNESARGRSGWVNSVFEVDLKSGKGRLLEAGTNYTQDWAVDAGGAPVARTEWLPERESFTLLVKRGGSWHKIYEESRSEPLGLAGLTADGKSVVLLGPIGDGRSRAWAMPIDGSPHSVLYEEPEGTVTSAWTDDDTHAVVGFYTGGLSPTTRWIDPKRAPQFKSLANAFPGRRVTEIDRSRDGERMLAMVDSPERPPVYHLVDFGKGRADVVGDAYPPLANAKLGETRDIGYAARDGTTIPAYLTLPPGLGPKNLPLVVLPHGGPHSHDDDSFNYMVQFLATRGYAVLQPQFRGSTGFGDAFMRAGYRQWGGLMQDDVTDGVRHLIEDGTADPKRICIVGGSYGGYAALAGAAFTPELYACAASIAGVSDLPTLLQESKVEFGSESDAVNSDEETIGRGSDPQVIAKSPARAAANVRAPILLLHGLDDSVVPVAQSERMEKALRAAGKPVTFVKLAGEDHWLSRADTRLQVLKELDKFLGQYLH